MAESMDPIESRPFPITADTDPALVDSSLAFIDLPDYPLGEHTANDPTHAVWEQVIQHPALRSYIDRAAHKIAPESPRERAQITRSMLGLLSLVTETETTHELEKWFDEQFPAVS